MFSATTDYGQSVGNEGARNLHSKWAELTEEIIWGRTNGRTGEAGLFPPHTHFCAACVSRPSSFPFVTAQKKDEHVTEVIGHSSHVTIYALDISSKSWVSLVESNLGGSLQASRLGVWT